MDRGFSLRIIVAAAAIVAALIVSSCTTPVEYKIALGDDSQSSLTFPFSNSQIKVPFATTQEWSASSDGQSWITVSPSKGVSGANSITITVSENGPEDERTGAVNIVSGTTTKTISVRQAAKTALTLSTERLEVASEGGSAEVSVSHTADYTAAVTEGSDWIKITSTKAMETSTLSLSVTENTAAVSRTGKVELTSSDNLTATLTVIQMSGRRSVFNENDIIASFGVMSDTHLYDASSAPAVKLTNALTQLKAMAAASSDSDGLDGILVAGDFIDSGYNSSWGQLTSWKTIYEGVFNPSTEFMPMTYCLGNHDVIGWWSSKSNLLSTGKQFRSIFGDKYYTKDQDVDAMNNMECRHVILAGYDILSISPTGGQTPPVVFDDSAVQWLDNKLKTLTTANPDKYVIILMHAMVQNTVYGSNLVSAGYESSDPTVASYWYTTALTDVLKKYPQAVIFGGHLHFPINDPRSIWQGDFTAFGCASTRYMAFEGGDLYVNKYSGTTLNDKDNYSEGYLIQFDASGNMRALRMDFYHSSTIGDPWIISYPDATGKTHLQKYNAELLRKQNVAPKLSSLEVTMPSSSSSYVPCTAKWAAATDDNDVFPHHYELQWQTATGSTSTVWIMSDYYCNAKPSTMKKSWEYTLGAYPEGTYTVSVTAVDTWGARSETLTKSFTVSPSGGGDDSQLPDPYVEISFFGGLSDKRGHATLTNAGASLSSSTVTFGGKSATASILATGPSSSAWGEFKEYTSSEGMKAFGMGGFSVEAFYRDKTGSNAVQGILCGTEKGGWGLAERANGNPYFIVGEDKTNTYKNVDATSAASKSDLTHVVGVYDSSSKTMSIYVNGVLNGTASISGSFYPGEGDTFNRFRLGADIAPGNTTVHFQSADMQIAVANIYSSALSASQVKLAFEAAKKTVGVN